MAAPKKPSIDLNRLQVFLNRLNDYGRQIDGGGFSRRAFSEADLAARRWLVGEMQAAGLEAGIDAAGNVLGWWRGDGDEPGVLVGSHIDTVVSGGAFDGALGVAVGLECVKAMKAAGVRPSRTIGVVATSDEEGRFGGMLGSQALSGQVSEDWLRSAIDADRVPLWDAMTAAGFDPAAVPGAALEKGSVAAFLELHIEQGPVLEWAGKPIGVVDVISGVCNWTVKLHGVANHAGSTPMAQRADAFAGLAAVATTIPALIETIGTEQSKITIGKVALQPNTPHTIPGEAEFSVIFKETDERVMRFLTDGFAVQLERAAAAHRLDYEVEEQSWLPPVALDAELRALVAEEAERLSLEYIVMPSGGAHDSQTMTDLCPTALIFVPSKAGVSHAPDEDTDWDDIGSGASLMLAVLMRLCAAA